MTIFFCATCKTSHSNTLYLKGYPELISAGNITECLSCFTKRIVENESYTPGEDPKCNILCGPHIIENGNLFKCKGCGTPYDYLPKGSMVIY
jgi:hypothetical protein